MGVFSKHVRYREAGEAANVNNVARFGQPHHSLFTSTKVLSFRHRIEITDDNENVKYRTESKVLSLHDRTEIYDASERLVARMWRKVFSLHERHFVQMADGTEFQLSNELWHLVRDITNIEGLGWQLRGNIAGLNFELYDEQERVIAVIGQKLFSLHDKYCVDIYQPDKEPIVVAILVTLQHMMADRASSASAGGGSAASSSG